jgi:hypothetical protein
MLYRPRRAYLKKKFKKIWGIAWFVQQYSLTLSLLIWIAQSKKT